MKQRLIQWWSVIGLLMALTAMTGRAVAAETSGIILSTNIPLDSYIYSYLHKLERLGYGAALLPDTKPYTRIQAARWVRPILSQSAAGTEPVYARTMLVRLAAEFGRELSLLETGDGDHGLWLETGTWENSYYDGAVVRQHENGTSSTYQPLNINNDGRKLAEGLNSALSLRWEGRIAERLVFSATPLLTYDETDDCAVSLATGYLKTRLGNLGIQVGKDALWWGPGERGTLPLTNNAAARTTLKLSNIEPVRPEGVLRFLGQLDGVFCYSELEEHRDVPGASYVGFRLSATPGGNLTFGGSLNSIVGGEGHQLSGGDYLDFFTGSNADSPETEKWNSIAGFDFRWRIPQLRGVQVYGELYGEDQAGKFPPLPTKHAWVYGVAIPRLTPDGRWELLLEQARTSDCWYRHWVYKDGYTYKGDIIGDAMGSNASRYYLKLSRYLTDGSLVSLNAERLTMDRDAAHPLQVDSWWVAYQMNLKPDLTLTATVGMAELTNPNYQTGQSGRNYQCRLKLNHRF